MQRTETLPEPGQKSTQHLCTAKLSIKVLIVLEADLSISNHSLVMTGIQDNYFQYLIYVPPSKDSGWVVYVDRHAENGIM